MPSVLGSNVNLLLGFIHPLASLCAVKGDETLRSSQGELITWLLEKTSQLALCLYLSQFNPIGRSERRLSVSTATRNDDGEDDGSGG